MGLIVEAKFPPERRFLIENYEQVESNRNHECVLEHRQVTEEESLTDKQQRGS